MKQVRKRLTGVSRGTAGRGCRARGFAPPDFAQPDPLFQLRPAEVRRAQPDAGAAPATGPHHHTNNIRQHWCEHRIYHSTRNLRSALSARQASPASWHPWLSSSDRASRTRLHSLRAWQARRDSSRRRTGLGVQMDEACPLDVVARTVVPPASVVRDRRPRLRGQFTAYPQLLHRLCTALSTGKPLARRAGSARRAPTVRHCGVGCGLS